MFLDAATASHSRRKDMACLPRGSGSRPFITFDEALVTILRTRASPPRIAAVSSVNMRAHIEYKARSKMIGPQRTLALQVGMAFLGSRMWIALHPTPPK